jgi:cation transport ATPase
MKKRSPAGELKQAVIVWGLVYIFAGLMTFGAVEAGKAAKLWLFMFFCLTPFFVIFGYLTLRDAWRDVPMQDADAKMIVPMLAFAAGCYLLYRFV